MTLIRSLEERLQQPLPGKDAHYKMAHVGRNEAPPIPPHAKDASILTLLYQKETDWYTVLMKRTSHFGHDRHKGQVSFPGGKAEPTDPSRAATALREAEEEIGLPQTGVRIIGALSQIYIPVSNFLVHPYIGYMETPPSFIPDPMEVAEIIEAPLDVLVHTGNHKRADLTVGGGFRLQNVPYFDVFGHVVWGATSMMISELIHVLDEVGYNSTYTLR